MSDPARPPVTAESVAEAPIHAGAAPADPADRLPIGLIWTYCLPTLGIGMMGLLFAMYLMKFSTDVLGIAPAAMGMLFALSRFWDAVSDPMAGYLSDRTTSRLGRRRSWMYASALPLALGVVCLWSPPTGLSGTLLVLWMGAALLLYETASTAYYIPHGALGVELASNYHERTRLFGYRHVITAFGLSLGLVAFWVVDNAEETRAAAFWVSVVGGLIIAALILFSTARLPERSDFQGRGGTAAFSSFRDVVRNPHARLLLIVYGIETFGVSSIAMLVPYLTEYVLHAKELTIPIIACYFVPQFIFTPFWIALSRRVGKKSIWVFSMGVTACSFSAFFIVPEEPSVWIFVLAGLLGLAGGAGAVAAPSIKADIIDYDELKTGERKEGAYLAVWNFVRKAAGGLTAILTGFALQLADFTPNEEQSDAAKTVIRLLFSLVPGGCYAVGTLIFMRFRFNEAEHAEVRSELNARARANRNP
ncbi:MAG: MFS transporter [Deltaproteobacteria bacterium]|nr:MFS transporter [Deltaproteobacteria bacterium]